MDLLPLQKFKNGHFLVLFRSIFTHVHHIAPSSQSANSSFSKGTTLISSGSCNSFNLHLHSNARAADETMQDWNLMGRYPWDRRTELASHIPEQIAHWLGQSAQEVGIMCLQQNNNNKKNHTNTTQFGKDYSPTFKTMVNTELCQHLHLLSGTEITHGGEGRKGPPAFSHQTINQQGWAQGSAPGVCVLELRNCGRNCFYFLLSLHFRKKRNKPHPE